MVGGEYSDRTIRAHKLKGKKNEKLAKLTANPILQFGFAREVEQQQPAIHQPIYIDQIKEAQQRVQKYQNTVFK